MAAQEDSSRRAQSWDLVAVGGLVLDLIVPIPALPIEAGKHQLSDWTKWEAGGDANTLIMGARLGLNVTAISALGLDAPGRRVADILHAEGVDVTGTLFLEDQETPTAIVIVDQAGDHVFVGGWGQAAPLPLQAEWLSIVRRSAALFTTGYALVPTSLIGPATTIRCLQEAKTRRCPSYLDLGPPEYLSEPERVAQAIALSDVLLATSEEMRQWSRKADPVQAAQSVLATGPRAVVLKDGAQGCRIVTQRAVIACPGFAVDAIDTVGAGDAFAAGLIASRLQGLDWYEAGRFANAVGAAAVMRIGTGSLLPTRDDVEAILKT